MFPLEKLWEALPSKFGNLDEIALLYSISAMSLFKAASLTVMLFSIAYVIQSSKDHILEDGVLDASCAKENCAKNKLARIKYNFIFLSVWI